MEPGRPARAAFAPAGGISKLAAFLEQHQALFAASTPARARVALLCSEATWKLGSVEGKGQDPEPAQCADGRRCPDRRLDGLRRRRAERGYSGRDRFAERPGQAYAVLILPGCTALEDASLPALRAYVEQGGTLLADGLCGYKEPGGWLRDPAANPLNELFGAALADIQALPDGQSGATLGDLSLPVWFLQAALQPHEGTGVLALLR